jgi:glycerate kinase
MFETTTLDSGTFGIGMGTTTGTTTLGYSGTSISNGITFLGSTDTFLGLTGTNLTTITSISTENMRTQQVKVAVFTITRDVDTNEITSTKFVKELWVEKKNGTSIDLIVAKQLDADFDPETTVVKELFTISF